MYRFWVALWACVVGSMALAAPAAARSAFRLPIQIMFDHPAANPGVRMLEVRPSADGTLSGLLTSDWYGPMPMTNIVAKSHVLRFDVRNLNTRGVPTRQWTATFGVQGVVLDGGIWASDVHQVGHRATPAQYRSLTFHEAPLPPFAALPADGLAQTPPMGWSSWNKFAEHIDDKTVRAMADSMVSSGLRDAGYVYVNIDDGWQGTRGPDGQIRPNAKFPDMKALADYVHSRGLKLGIYSSPGLRTCAGFEGSYGHVAQDARTFAAWGIDYLKYDLCSGEWFYADKDSVQRTYAEMGAALRATGRPIVYSLCEYGRFDVGSWGRSVGGHLWRTTGDITDQYGDMAKIGFEHNGNPGDAGPGGWNDPDMLEIGNGGMSDDEYRSHMALWAMSAAPLLMGHDLRLTSAGAKALLENRAVIAIDQDAKGVQGVAVRKQGALEIWRKALADGDVAIAIFNRGNAPSSIGLDAQDIGAGNVRSVRDLWTGSVGTSLAHAYAIPAHGVVMLRIATLS
ncbi:glycoside hydrolase family 27 protein [Sphingomonas abietis]|uniref:Alpha-galactosidase n=1 Tax=Sphingomonas abietis TaxID=3012344 RepID=A0ABY7NRR7_9SPHN|nr:glycoside hydrolase family 27 protein [Sphingomonas abietis]WBO24229.1 glycoside hydrolase family 27 protein [Sphingomonas abietis]